MRPLDPAEGAEVDERVTTPSRRNERKRVSGRDRGLAPDAGILVLSIHRGGRPFVRSNQLVEDSTMAARRRRVLWTARIWTSSWKRAGAKTEALRELALPRGCATDEVTVPN